MTKACRACGRDFAVKKSHLGKVSYCSAVCMAHDFRSRLLGEANPNYRALPPHVCARCSAEFNSYNKARKYCSQACYRDRPNQRRYHAGQVKRYVEPSSPPHIGTCSECAVRPVARFAKTCSTECRIARQRRLRVTPEPNHVCRHCRVAFHSYAKVRKHCSYRCLVESGGIQRRARMAMRARQIYGARQDANHKDVFAVLAARGIWCMDLSHCCEGVPDGIAAIDAKLRLFEVKNRNTHYGRKGLNPVQKGWVQRAGVPVYILETVADAERFALGQFSLVKAEWPKVTGVNS